MTKHKTNRHIRKLRKQVELELKEREAEWVVDELPGGYTFHVAWRGQTLMIYIQTELPHLAKHQLQLTLYGNPIEVEPYNKKNHDLGEALILEKGELDPAEKHLKLWFKKIRIQQIGQPGELLLIKKVKRKLNEYKIQGNPDRFVANLKEKMNVRTDEELEVGLQHFTFFILPGIYRFQGLAIVTQTGQHYVINEAPIGIPMEKKLQ